jgi:hypothetical protein
MRKLAAIILASVLCGCTATYTQAPVRAPRIKLPSGANVAVATPRNGTYGSKVYDDSGRATADAVRAAFARYAGEITVVAECQNAACLREKVPFASYLAVPEILHWEDRATEWSGKKDKLEIRLSIYDVATLDLIASTVIAGKSKWATFGGDHPQDLLPQPLNEYVGSLY